MKLTNKTIDKNKNKCKVCSNELYLDDIITDESLLCHNCHTVITNISTDNIEYNFYKEKIKSWILSKYELIK